MKNLYIDDLPDYFKQYKKSIKNPKKFWDKIADEGFVWYQRWTKVVDFDMEEAKIKWFKNAKLNITKNALDRHLSLRGDKTAIIALVPGQTASLVVDEVLHELQIPPAIRGGAHQLGVQQLVQPQEGGVAAHFLPYPTQGGFRPPGLDRRQQGFGIRVTPPGWCRPPGVQLVTHPSGIQITDIGAVVAPRPDALLSQF